MKKIVILFLLIYSMNLYAQNKNSNEFNLGIQFGVLPLGQTKLNTKFTFGLESEYLFKISNSIKLGGNLSYHNASGTNNQPSFTFIPLNFAVKWYPNILIEKLTNGEIKTRNLYFKTELGYTFSKVNSNDNGCSGFGIGYMFEITKSNMIDVMIIPTRKNGISIATDGIINFSSVSIKYCF